MAEPAGAVLVIGATGILRPAVQMLLARGASVVAIARDATALAALAAMARTPRADVLIRAVDAHDALELTLSLDGLSLNAAIVYDPAVSVDSLMTLAKVVKGPVVRVLTSSALDPSRPGLPTRQIPFTRLVLGWTDDGRWHTPAEVSAAAIAALDAAEGASRTGRTPAQDGTVLGGVRPWSERPV